MKKSFIYGTVGLARFVVLFSGLLAINGISLAQYQGAPLATLPDHDEKGKKEVLIPSGYPWQISIMNIGDLPRSSPGGQNYYKVGDHPMFIAVVMDSSGVVVDNPISMTVGGVPYLAGDEFVNRGDHYIKASCQDPFGNEVSSGHTVRFYDYEYIPVDVEVAHYSLSPVQDGYDLDLTVWITTEYESVYDINTASMSLWVAVEDEDLSERHRFWVDGVYEPGNEADPESGNAVVADSSAIAARFRGHVHSDGVYEISVTGSSMRYANDFVFDAQLFIPDMMDSSNDDDWPGGPAPGVIIEPGSVEPVPCKLVRQDKSNYSGFEVPLGASGITMKGNPCIPLGKLFTVSNWWLVHKGHGWNVSRAMVEASDVWGNRQYSYSGGGAWQKPFTELGGHGTVQAEEYFYVSCNSGCSWNAMAILKGQVTCSATAEVKSSWLLGWLVGGRAVAVSGSMIEATFEGGGTYADEALAVASVTKQQEVTITYPPGVRTTIPLSSIDDDMPVRDTIQLNRILGTKMISGRSILHVLFTGHDYISASAHGGFNCIGASSVYSRALAIASTPSWDVRVEFRLIPEDDCAESYGPIHWP